MKTMDDYKVFLAAVRKETGIEALTSDETGLVTVNVDEKYNVNLQFVGATGRILCFVEVAQLPADTPKDVYRDLLAGGLFGKETAGGYFALEPETETIVYNYYFDLEQAAADVEARELDELQYPVRSARQEARLAYHHPPDVDGRKAVDVLLGRDGVDDALLVEPLR